MDLTTSSSALPSFVFPILKPAEITVCLQQLGVELSVAELSEPQRHKEKLRFVFLCLVSFYNRSFNSLRLRAELTILQYLLDKLDVCMGITEEDLQASPALLTAAWSLPFPELHTAESYSELQFFNALRNLFEICFYHDFSWRDMHTPTAKRLRHQLSAVINLAKFREEQLKIYAELSEPRAELVQTLEERNQENEKLMEQLDHAEMEGRSKFNEMEEIIRECQELELEIARNNRRQASSREEAASLKKKANDLKDELATAVWALQEAEAEEERLRLEIVSSPDRRKSEIAFRRAKLDKVKQESEELEMRLQQSRIKIVNAKQLLKDLEVTLQKLDELHEEVTKYRDLVRDLEGARGKIHETEKKTEGLLKEIDDAERELNRAEEKIVHQRKQHKMQVDALHDALDAAKKELLAVEKERRDGMARVETGEAEVRALEAAIEVERVKTDNEIQLMIAEYKDTEKLFLERNAARMTLLDTAS